MRSCYWTPAWSHHASTVTVVVVMRVSLFLEKLKPDLKSARVGKKNSLTHPPRTGWLRRPTAGQCATFLCFAWCRVYVPVLPLVLFLRLCSADDFAASSPLLLPIKYLLTLGRSIVLSWMYITKSAYPRGPINHSNESWTNQNQSNHQNHGNHPSIKYSAVCFRELSRHKATKKRTEQPTYHSITQPIKKKSVQSTNQKITQWTASSPVSFNRTLQHRIKVDRLGGLYDSCQPTCFIEWKKKRSTM